MKVGLGFRHRHAAALRESARDVDVLEIMPSHFFANPQAIAAVAECAPCVFHDVCLSLGSSVEDGAELERIRALIDVAKPALFSEHLALTASDEFDLGHLAPVWRTEEKLIEVCARVRRWQDALGVPVAIETITAPFEIPGADMSEGEFFSALVRETGCGVLVDLTNIAINAHNFAFDARQALSAYPLDHVVQVHLAGGTEHAGWRVDSHSAPVDRASLELFEWLKGRAPVEYAIIERDEELPSLDVLLDEADDVRAIWTSG